MRNIVHPFVGNCESDKEKDKKLASKSVKSSLALIVGVYLVLYVPVFLVSVALEEPSPQWMHDLYLLTLLMFYCSTWINPIIYALKIADYRKVFGKILHTCCVISRRSVALPTHNIQ